MKMEYWFRNNGLRTFTDPNQTVCQFFKPARSLLERDYLIASKFSRRTLTCSSA